MRLPDRLDYEEAKNDGEDSWWPDVVCPVCGWRRVSLWSDLGDDGDVDWDSEHPEHPSPASSEPVREAAGLT